MTADPYERLLWDPGDVVVRPPTPAEVSGLEWDAPREPPPFSPTKADEINGADGLTAAVREHGELGPVLVNGDHHFTSASDI